jgi:hypothetical protein
MTFNQHRAQATFTVPEDFDLDAFIQDCHDDCIKDENFIWQNYGMSPHGLVMVDLRFWDYISRDGKDLCVTYDTEELNSDGDVAEWLTARFAPVMESETMKIETFSFVTKRGLDVKVSFLTKTGKLIEIHDLLEVYRQLHPDSF